MTTRTYLALGLSAALSIVLHPVQPLAAGQATRSVKQESVLFENREIGVRAMFPKQPSVDSFPTPDELKGKDLRSLICLTDTGAFMIGRVNTGDRPSGSRDTVLGNIGRGIAQGVVSSGDSTISGPVSSRLGGEPALEFQFSEADRSGHGVLRVTLVGKYCYFAMAAGDEMPNASLYSDFLDAITFLPLVRAAHDAPN